MMSFGDVRALVQSPPTAQRDFILCTLLRDSARQDLVESGVLRYVLNALCSAQEVEEFSQHPGRLIDRLRSGELWGLATEMLMDLRGYVEPSQELLLELVARSHQTPIKHLLLDWSYCGEEWLVRLLNMGAFNSLEWLSLRGCGLDYSDDYFGYRGPDFWVSVPEGLVGLDVGHNILGEWFFERLKTRVGPTLKWLGLANLEGEEEGALNFIQALEDVQLLGMNVQGVRCMDDQVFDLGVQLGVFDDLLDFRAISSGLSEFGMQSLLWSLPEGQLEALEFGDIDSEREYFLDADSLDEVLALPALQALHHVKIAFSEYPESPLDAPQEEALFLSQFGELDCIHGIEFIGFYGFCFDVLIESCVLAELVHVDGLALEQMWSRKFNSKLRLQAGEVLGKFKLHRLDLGLLDEDRDLDEMRWFGWGDALVERWVRSVVEQLDMSEVRQLNWNGLRGFEEMSQALLKLRYVGLEYITVLCDESYEVFYDISWVVTDSILRLSKASWWRQVHRFDVESALLAWRLSPLLGEILHPRFKRALLGKAP